MRAPQDIVGQTVTNVFSRTDDVDGVTMVMVFWELNGRTIVESPNDESDLVIISGIQDLEVFEDAAKCVGAKVDALLATDCLPHFGVLLSNGVVIHCESLTPERFDWYVRPYSQDIVERYDFREIR